MKKWIIAIFIAVILIPIVNAQGFGNCAFGNFPFGNCVITTPPPSEGGEGGGEGGLGGPSTQGFTSVLYDVIIELQKTFFLPEEIVTAKIIITNKQGVPTKDSILNYYLLSPDNETVAEVQNVFLPEEKTEYTYDVKLKLPQNTKLGEWKFVVDFQPIEIDPILAFVGFEVKKELSFIDKIKNIKNSFENMTLIVIVVFAIVIFYSMWKSDFKEKERRGEFDDRTMLKRLEKLEGKK